MILSTPLAAFGFLTVAALAAVYCFRRKSPPRAVSSLMLWPGRKVASSASNRRDRLRTPPVFWLELLALLAIVTAALSPLAWRRSAGTLHVILDRSASMHADGSAPLQAAEDFLAREKRNGVKDAIRVKTATDDAGLARELAAAESVRAPGDEILVLTDRAPAEDLRPGVRWKAFGKPLPNDAITACRRRRREPGTDSVFLEARRFGSAAGTPAFVTIESEAKSAAFRPVSRRLDFDSNGVARVSLTVDAGSGPLVARLADDALADDNRVTLSVPDVPSLAVCVSIKDDALRTLVHRALRATGGVREETDAAHAEFIVTDRATVESAAADAFTFRFLPSAGKRRTEPVWTDPSEPTLDGLSLDGDPYALSAETPAGRPVAFLGADPLAAVSARTFELAFSDPSLPFFRSPTFPALVENVLLAAHRAHHPRPPEPENLLDVGESDLTSACAFSGGSRATAPDDVRRTRSVAWIFALVALLALAVHFRFIRRKATLAVIALVALAALRPVIPIGSTDGTLLVLADRSRSMDGEALKEQERIVAALAKSRPAGAELGVIAFGESAAVESHPGTPAPTEFVQQPGLDGSSIEAALARAGALAEPGRPARCLVLSDGLFTSPIPVHPPFPVDAYLQSRPFARDLSVSRVDAPDEIAPRAVVPVTAWVQSDVPCTNAYTLACDTNVVCRGHLACRAGLTPLVLRDFATGPGLRRYTLTIEPSADDPCRENNVARFLVKVAGRRPLLLMRESPSPAAETIAAAGVPLAVRTAPDLPRDLAALADFSGVLLEDVPATRFEPAFLRDLAASVTDLGQSLAMTGGERAFGQGGWYRTPVEDILPISLELRDEHRKYAIALAIVMDRSGSMACGTTGGRTKMDMANMGATGAIEMLSGLDKVAVIAVDSTPHVVLPMQDAESAKRQSALVRGIRSMGGGIFVEQGLLAGFRELEKADAKCIKHIILFADASDSEAPGDYEKYLAKAAESGITVSVIALGSPTDCDAELLRKIAAAGSGECWFEANAQEIPRLFMQDTFLVAKQAMCTNPTPLKVLAPVRQISDAIPVKLANAGGYNLTYAREGSENAIVTEDEEHAPFLAFRRVGLGRTLALTGELSGNHAAPLMTSRDGAELAASVARWTHGDGRPATDGFTLSRRIVPGGFVVTAVADEDDEATAVPNSGLPLTVLVEKPGQGAEKRLQSLVWEDSGTLSAFVPLTGDEIAFPVVRLPRGASVTLPPVRLPHPAEYVRPTDPLAGKRALERLASVSGGSLLVGIEEIWDSLPSVRTNFPLAPFIYLTAAILFLTAVFLRRVGFEIKLGWKRPASAKLPPPKKKTAPAKSEPRPAAKQDEEPEDSLGAAFAKAKKRAGRL